MKKLISTLSCTALLIAANTRAQTAQILTGFNHIESIAEDDGYLYAGDIGKALEPAAKDGDGKVIKMDRDGHVMTADFVKETLHAPKGLAIYRGVLYLTDIDRVLAIDLKTGVKSYEIDFSKDSGFLNDIAVWDEQTLFVSATDKSKLFKADLVSKTYTEIKASVAVPGINGLYCRKKADRLYVNGLGSGNQPNGIVGYINLKDNSFTQIAMPPGLYDGIALKNGALYVSDWVAFEPRGVVRETLTHDTDKVSLTTKSLRIPGPADFIISGNKLIVPAMLSGEIYIFNLN